MAGICLEGVSKVFPDGTAAVEGLDLEVPDGGFTVLVGPSGSGKSTALRMVAGLEDATGGTIRIGDEVVNHVAPKDRDIAMVFQSYALYPHMTVDDNMAFGLRMRKTAKPDIAERVGRAAGRLGLGELMARRPRALSGGQRQRVALGRAIVRAPRAFLMDEPLSNLDAKLRVEMRAYISTLHAELGTTTLYVTHDQTEAMTMGDRVAIMRDGRLEQVDSPQALYDEPASLFVAGFMGSPAMNLLEGRLEADERGAVWLGLGSSRLRLPDALLARRPVLRGRAGERVVAGIRPESFAPAADGQADDVLDLPVVLVEALGSDLLVHLESDADAVLTGERLEAAVGMDEAEAAHEVAVAPCARLVARLPPGTPTRAGERLRVRVDLDRVHVFDRGTGRAVR